MLKKWFRRTLLSVVLSVVALCVVWVWQAVPYYTGKPNIAKNYAAELNATMPKPGPEGGAWDDYVDYVVATSYPPDTWPVYGVDDEGREDSLEYWHEVRDKIPALLASADKPALGFVLDDAVDERLQTLSPDFDPASIETASANPEMVDVLLEPLGTMRGIARLFMFDAWEALRRGDGETYVRNMAAILRMADQCRQIPVGLAQMVGVNMAAWAFDFTSDAMVAHAGAFDDAQLRELLVLFEPYDAAWGRVSMANERYMFADFLQRYYTDDGSGNGRQLHAGYRHLNSFGQLLWEDEPPKTDIRVLALAPLKRLRFADRRSLLEKWDERMGEYEAIGRTPLWERGDRERIWNETEDDLVPAYYPVALFTPDNQPLQVGPRLVMHRDAARVVLALELHRRTEGGYPAVLDELVPAYLPSVPLDRFDGQPIRYAVGDAGPVVYGVGPDLDDDGGEPGRVSRLPRWRSPAEVARMKAERDRDLRDGDWVLWPPPEREPRRGR